MIFLGTLRDVMQLILLYNQKHTNIGKVLILLSFFTFGVIPIYETMNESETSVSKEDFSVVKNLVQELYSKVPEISSELENVKRDLKFVRRSENYWKEAMKTQLEANNKLSSLAVMRITYLEKDTERIASLLKDIGHGAREFHHQEEYHSAPGKDASFSKTMGLPQKGAPLNSTRTWRSLALNKMTTSWRSEDVLRRPEL